MHILCIFESFKNKPEIWCPREPREENWRWLGRIRQLYCRRKRSRDYRDYLPRHHSFSSCLIQPDKVDIVFRQTCASRCCFCCCVTIDPLALCVSPIYVYICVYRYMYTQMCVYVCIWAYIYICICIQNMVVYMCPFPLVTVIIDSMPA